MNEEGGSNGKRGRKGEQGQGGYRAGRKVECMREREEVGETGLCWLAKVYSLAYSYELSIEVGCEPLGPSN